MKKFWFLLMAFIGSLLLVIYPNMPVMAEISPSEINAIARLTTVLIAPGLTPQLIKDIENNRNNPLAINQERAWNPGSGVIVAQQGNTYYVQTVAHNFRQDFLNNNNVFGIRTWDGEIHQVTSINDRRGCPLSGAPSLSKLIRFGCKSPGVDPVGIDLAIVSFNSNKNYSIAPIGNASQINTGDTVYVSGWPNPEGEIDRTGNCRNRVARRQRRLTRGKITGKQNPDSSNKGYSIFYTNQTRVGMSGGPVFNAQGQLVGNHGLGAANQSECGRSQPPNTSNYQDFSSGQNIDYSVSLIRQIASLPFSQQPLDANTIKKGMVGQSVGQISATGAIEFDISSDAYDDPNDVETNIYQSFSKSQSQQLRDCPTGVSIDEPGCDDGL